MKTMGIAELKAMLSETLVRVKAGEEVIVTEHSRPIARLVPLSSATPAAATQELVRAGLVKAPEKTLDESFWQLPRAQYRQGEEPARRDLDEAEEWKLREAV
jgi:prevent-host-death family protein